MYTGAGDFEHAVRIRHEVEELYRSYCQFKDKKARAGLNSMIRTYVPSGLYEHWESEEEKQKFYAVLGVGFDEDIHTPLVTYAALYQPNAGNLTYKNLLDEKDGFLIPIVSKLYTGPRFKLVTELTLHQIATLLQHAGALSTKTETVRFRKHAGDLVYKYIPLY